MSTPGNIERARQELEEQLRQISELRNASTRDTTFKQWRQNTLTLIQRLWPGDAERAERFRRVRFSAPFAKANPNQVRDYYARACAEVTRLLKAMIEEVGASEVPGAAPLMERAAEPPKLPAEVEAGPVAEDDGGSNDMAAASRTAADPPRSVGPPRLKDMLGFGDLSDDTPPAGREALPPPAAALRFRATPAVAKLEPRTEPPPRPGPPPAAARDDERELRAATEAFLSASPVLRLEGKPVGRERGPSPQRPSAAIAVEALAAEVESLGVPEGHRARARAGLRELAGRMDAQSLDWTALRETVGWVMEFPALARRVLPLLLPYVDAAA